MTWFLQPDLPAIFPRPSAPAKAAVTASPAPQMAGDRYAGPPGTGMPPAAKRRAELLTSLFENDTLELQYGYAEDLHDGRGITAGRAGFCSGEQDMANVIGRYVQQVPNSPLAAYLPALADIAAGRRGRSDTSRLKGLEAAWARAAQDPRFRQAQDAVVDELYFQPAMAFADRAGVHSALGRAIFYDTIIQHGGGDDPDGLPALIARTNARASGADEVAWLKAFLAVRRADLAHAHDPETRAVWADSTGRVDAQAAILAQGNLDLHGPIRLKAGGYDTTIP